MKKRLAVFTLILFVFLSLSLTAFATYFVSGTSSLKLRAKPNDSAAVLGSYRQDYAVTSYKKFDKNWAYVHFSSGKAGYVRTKYLKSSKSSNAYVKADDTVLYAGPASSFAKKATLSKGTKIKVLTSGKTWNYVRTSSGYGYMRKSGLSSKYVKPTAKPKPYTAYIVNPNGGKVNVRRNAGKGYAAVTSLTPGSAVTVQSTQGNWSKVTVNGITGYVHIQYLSKTKPSETAVSAGVATTAKTYTAYIKTPNGGKANVRRGAGSGYALVRQLPYGTKVTVIKDSPSSKWAHISFSGGTGYVQSQYISKSVPKTVSGVPAPGKTYTAKIKSPDNKAVNLRRGAGKGYASIAKLEIGTKVTVLGTSGKWSKVQVNGMTGYVMTQYLKK